MRTNSSMLAVCALLSAGAACAHDQPRERASVSAVTNSEVAANEDPNKTRMHYTEVSDERSLGRDNDPNSGLAEGNGLPRTEHVATAGGASGSGVDECELAIHFETDSARLDQGAQALLDRVADCMKRHQVDHATIVGQTDPTGSAQHNDQLGMERARAVAEYLRSRGVPEKDIRVRSKGEMASANDSQLWPAERNAQIGTTR